MNNSDKRKRKGISLPSLFKMFPDDDAARTWFEKQIWPEGPRCPHCGTENVQCGIKHKTMTHRCRECPNRPMFSLRKGTIMEGSNLGYQIWAIAIYQVTTNLKGVSSLKLHRDLGITQKSAWHLAHRLRKSMEGQPSLFCGPVEVDETYIGGKRKNMPLWKQKQLTGRGAAGKTAVVGAEDRETNQVFAKTVRNTNKPTLQRFVI